MSSPTTHRNVKAICAVEHEALARRSVSSRLGDFIATQAGKMWFIVLHVFWFAVWIGWNLVGSSKPFDPFPFSLLTMIVSLESIFLSLFIMMSQNRSNVQADQRNHLDLQINLLSEDENTKIIQMLQALCEHHKLPIGHDREIEEFAKRTELQDVLDDIKHNLPTTT
jgi:uncharacterized membrane protein